MAYYEPYSGGADYGWAGDVYYTKNNKYYIHAYWGSTWDNDYGSEDIEIPRLYTNGKCELCFK